MLPPPAVVVAFDRESIVGENSASDTKEQRRVRECELHRIVADAVLVVVRGC